MSSFAQLRERLHERFVIVEPDERAARIARELGAAATEGSFDDHGLREEWRDLVEYPTVMVGEVPQEFRGLPPEVLETVLVHHQKYIALRDAGGRIDRFAAVTNGDGAAAPAVTRGMQRVVVARLRDASFFLGEDRKRPLAERVQDLGGVTFHHGLGTYRDKSARMAALVVAMGRHGLLSGDALAAATQAAGLAKADLVTLMVREFPELQGTMGGIYLAGEGVSELVATAVRWHYHPVAVEADAAPAAAFTGRDEAARVFAAVALADKLDTLAGYFGIGENPTGSRDPYGLRRAGQGVGARRARLLAPEAWREGPGPGLARGRRGRRLPAAQAAGRRDDPQRPGLPARPPRVRALGAGLRLRRGRGGGACAGPAGARRSGAGARPRRSAPAREARGAGGLRGPGRGLQARQEHRRAGRCRRVRRRCRSSTRTPSARSTRT